MYRAITSFTTNEYEVRKKQLLADDFTNQDEITEFLRIGYIEVYDGSLEITENGIYNVEDYQTAEVGVQSGNLTDEEYAEANTDVDTILENTQLTPVYPPDWSQIGYTDTPKSIVDAFNYAKNLKNNWDSSITSLSYYFSNNTELVFMPLVDTSNVTTFYAAFQGCTSLFNVPLLNTGNVTSMLQAFQTCSQLENVPLLNTGKVTTMMNMFASCSKLKNVPVLDTSRVTNFASMFNYCSKLSNESLNNIMQMCINATSYTGTKTLVKLGLTSAQATTCQSLSNYQAFTNAGWTTGY